MFSLRETCVSDVEIISINITKETKAQHMLANALSCKSCTRETCSVNTSHKTLPRLRVALLFTSYFNVRFPTKGQVRDSLATPTRKHNISVKESKCEPSANSNYRAVKRVVYYIQKEKKWLLWCLLLFMLILLSTPDSSLKCFLTVTVIILQFSLIKIDPPNKTEQTGFLTVTLNCY